MLESPALLLSDVDGGPPYRSNHRQDLRLQVMWIIKQFLSRFCLEYHFG